MKSFLIFLVLIISVNAQCQTELILPKLGAPAKSVYQINPWTDGAIILGSGLGIIYGYANVDSLVKRRCPCESSEVNSFDRPALSNQNRTSGAIANALVAAAVLVPPGLDFLDIGAKDAFKDDLIVYLEVLSVTQVLTTATKVATQRPFPQHYQMSLSQQASDEGGGAFLSFFSGHTATTIAALSAASMTYGYRHGSSKLPWIVTGSLGTLIGIELVAAGEHYPSDVLVGGAVGLAMGTLIPYLHHKSDIEIAPILPSRTSDQLGIRLTKRF